VAHAAGLFFIAVNRRPYAPPPQRDESDAEIANTGDQQKEEVRLRVEVRCRRGVARGT